MCKIGGVVSGEIPGRGGDYPCPIDKKARRMDPHSTSMETHHACHRRPSDYHHPRLRQATGSGVLARTIAGHVRAHATTGRASPRPDRGVRSSGRSRNPAPALPSPDREGRSRTGSPAPARQRRGWHPRRGTRPFTFKTTFGEVTVERLRISHNHDGTIEIPSATVWNTSHQLAITQNLRSCSTLIETPCFSRFFTR